MGFIASLFKIIARCTLSFLLAMSFNGFLQSQNQQPIVKRFTSEDGFSNATVLDIVQDHQGYIWVAAQDGLVCYDGYVFVTYRNIPGDSTSLSQNRVEKLFVDSHGDIWIGSSTNLDRYNKNCDCFFRYSSYNSTLNNQKVGQINTFAEDQNNNLWIGTQEGGLFRYDRDNEKFIRYLDDPTEPNNILEDEVRTIFIDSKNQLWIGTGETFDPSIIGGGLIRMNLETCVTKRFTHDPANPNSLIDNRVSAITEDKDGKIWVGTCQSGLHYYEPEIDGFIRMTPDTTFYAPQGESGLWSSCPHVKFIHQGKNGVYWVGTYNGGVHSFDPKTERLDLYEHYPDNENTLGSNQVWSFLQDKQDRIWIGNIPGGLQMIDPSLHKFNLYSHNEKNPYSLSNNHVLGIYESPQRPGIIWIGTQGGGLNRLNIEIGKFKHYRHQTEDRTSISSDNVWATYEDSKGTFWVGTEAGLDTLDKETGQFTTHNFLENGVYKNISLPVIQIYEDSKGYLWIGTWSGGIVRLSKDRKTAKRYIFSNSSQQSFNNSVYTIHEDEKGFIWVGIFQNGLFKFDEKSDYFTHQLEDFALLSLQEDDAGNFWIGTESGVLYYNPTNDSYERYTAKDGLPSDVIYGLLIDNNRHIWFSTENGIAKFEPATKQFTTYGNSDGLPFSSFNFLSSFKNTNGQLFFGGTGGLVAFYPNEVKGNPYPPDVVLKRLQTMGDTIDFGAALLDITLTYKQNDLTFNYVGLHYTKPSENVYKYRMKPYDSDWIYAGSQRTARYTNLDPGEYTFEVTARSSDGVWNEKGATLKLYITPPWWTTWWAYILFSAIVLGIAYSLYKFQLSRKLAISENKRLSEVNHLKSTLYTNITHEFRTPITVILGMASNLKSNIESPQFEGARSSLKMIQRNGEKLLRLVNEMLDIAKLESGNMELHLVLGDVIPFVKYLVDGFQALANESKLNLMVYEEIDTLHMDFDADKLSTIVSNLLSNAIKFTKPGGKIIVHLSKMEDGKKSVFLIKVKDNGIGIDEEAIPKIFDRFYQVDATHKRKGEGTGIGLALTKEFIDLMQGTISVKSTIGKGSEFIVMIPVSRNAPMPLEMPVITENRVALREAADEVQYQALANDSHLPLALIVEDNPDVAIYLQTCLLDKYHTLHALNGSEGLNIAFEKIPDIIICDVMMPGKDGFEVCTILKSDPRTDHIPIIMLTAKATLKDRIAGLAHGADAYLTKPFVKAELFTRLDQLILLRKKMRKKFKSDGLAQILKNRASDPETKFIQKAINTIINEMNESGFGAKQLSHKLHLSESQLYRKLKAITGKSTAVFIRSVKLNKAREIILTTDKTISEVSYEIGFSDPSWFSKAFKAEFGYAPSAMGK